MIRDQWGDPSERMDESRNEHNEEESEEQRQSQIQDQTEVNIEREEEMRGNIQSQDQTLSQAIAGQRNQELNHPQAKDPTPSSSRGRGKENTGRKNKEETKLLEKWDKNTPICKFYKQDKCKFGQKCRNPHSKFCKTFMMKGSKRFNPMGCDNNCGKPHPSAFRNAFRSNECRVDHCKFYHMKGTKRGQWNPNQTRTGQPGITDQREENHSKENPSYPETSWRQQELQRTRDQVFMDTLKHNDVNDTKDRSQVGHAQKQLDGPDRTARSKNTATDTGPESGVAKTIKPSPKSNGLRVETRTDTPPPTTKRLLKAGSWNIRHEKET
jgi:hypothetical protein